MTYSTYTFYIDRLGRDTSFEDKLTSYCFRRSTANAIDSVASDAVRDQVIRHDLFTGVFNGAYINKIVRFNVQDTFLESEISDNGLTRAFTHMSIRYNPGAPKAVPTEMISSLLRTDPDIIELEKRFKALHNKIKWDYKFIKYTPSATRKQYEDLRKQLTNTKKSLKDKIENEFRKDYFFRIHNKIIKKQLNRQPSKTTEEIESIPVLHHQLKERHELQQILCDFSKGMSHYEINSRKVAAINLMVALASRQEFRIRKPRPEAASQEIDMLQPPSQLSPLPDQYPVVCAKTQCIICIGNERLSYGQRIRTFRRVAHMWDHVENVHLRNQAPNDTFVCHHPICKAKGLLLSSITEFKSHVARVHRIELRP
ncbi:hypothetical protein ACMFMG_004957 [Clarireedia jacksonii]